MTVRCTTAVRRIFNKGSAGRIQAKLGKNQRPEEPRLATLFFWTQRDKGCPFESGISVTHSQDTHLTAGYDGTTAAVSAQSVDH